MSFVLRATRTLGGTSIHSMASSGALEKRKEGPVVRTAAWEAESSSEGSAADYDEGACKPAGEAVLLHPVAINRNSTQENSSKTAKRKTIEFERDESVG